MMGITSRWPVGRLLVAVFVIGLVLRIGYTVFLGDEPLTDDAWYYDKKARTILQGEGFVNDHLYAYAAPGYSGFLVGVYALFGADPQVARVVQGFLGALTILLVYAVGRELAGKEAAVCAAAMVAFYPRLIQTASELWSETVFVFLIFSSLAVLARKREELSWTRGIVGGMLFGLAALTREIGLYASVALFFWAWIDRKSLGRAVRFIIPVFAGIGFVVAPWTIRNTLKLRSVVLVSTNGPINLYLGNNPEATGLFNWVLPEGVRWNSAEGEEFPGQNEIEATRTCRREAVTYMFHHPARTLQMAFKKVWYLWGIPTYAMDIRGHPVGALKQMVDSFYYLLVLVLAVAGTVTKKTLTRPLSLCYLVLGYHTMVHALTFGGVRYFIPLIPFLSLLAGVTLAWIIAERFSMRMETDDAE